MTTTLGSGSPRIDDNLRRLFAQRFATARLRGGEELTTVAKGLALCALAQ
ncbi:MAG TPA: hypothetical protein VGX03_05060 [Candidatus Binatia bacterium]|jgi:hypothetical protein|nr:hypothetical protein [Candidatus Binatia bacterium]